jgi:acyl carrier protein
LKNREELWARFIDVAVKILNVKPEQVVLAAAFQDDLEADSLDLVEFVMALEEEFDVNIEEEELEGVDTVGKAFDLVLQKLAEKADGSETDEESEGS